MMVFVHARANVVDDAVMREVYCARAREREGGSLFPAFARLFADEQRRETMRSNI